MNPNILLLDNAESYQHLDNDLRIELPNIVMAQANLLAELVVLCLRILTDFGKIIPMGNVLIHETASLFEYTECFDLIAKIWLSQEFAFSSTQRQVWPFSISFKGLVVFSCHFEVATGKGIVHVLPGFGTFTGVVDPFPNNVSK